MATGAISGVRTLLLFFVLQSTALAGLLPNGDFELGISGFSSDYTYISGDPHEPAEYTLLTDPGSVRSDVDSFFDHTFGDGSGLMLMGNGGLATDDVVWSTLVAVDSGSTYNFSLWVASWYAEYPGEFALRINSSPVGSTFFAPAVQGVWQQHSFSWTSGSAVSALIELINPSTDYTGNDFALDDLSFTRIASPPVEVPEPMTLALAALGLVALGLARRRGNARTSAENSDRRLS